MDRLLILPLSPNILIVQVSGTHYVGLILTHFQIKGDGWLLKVLPRKESGSRWLLMMRRKMEKKKKMLGFKRDVIKGIRRKWFSGLVVKADSPALLSCILSITSGFVVVFISILYLLYIYITLMSSTGHYRTVHTSARSWHLGLVLRESFNRKTACVFTPPQYTTSNHKLHTHKKSWHTL